MGTWDGYQHAELWQQLGLRDGFRVAWVELNPDAHATMRFVETVLMNRGFIVRLFADVDEAKTWLIREGEGAQSPRMDLASA